MNLGLWLEIFIYKGKMLMMPQENISQLPRNEEKTSMPLLKPPQRTLSDQEIWEELLHTEASQRYLAAQVKIAEALLDRTNL